MFDWQRITIIKRRRKFLEYTKQSKKQYNKKSLAEQLWLHYYNNTLFEKGIISETERNKMKNRIDSR